MPTYTKNVIQTLPITQAVNTTYTHQLGQGGIVDTLEFVQVAIGVVIRSPHNQAVSHTIGVSQAIVASKTKSDSDAVKVSQLIKFNRQNQRTVVQTLEFQQFVIARLDKSYHYVPPEIPPVNAPSGPASPTAPPVSPNTVNINSPVFTLSKSGDVLELRLPKFGDKDKYEHTRVKRNTRGGTLIIYRDPRWPEREILSVEFEYLSSTQAANLLTFMHTHLGKKITLTDQYSRTFNGFIITPESEVLQPKRIGYSARFDFQIYQVPPT